MSINTNRARMGRWLVYPALLLALSGCSGSLEREINGTVTLDGQPLQSGEIQFEPIAGSKGPTAGSTISNGSYQIPAVAQGVRAGNEYKVSITSMAGSGRSAPDPNSPSGERELLENIIPPRYNTESELNVTISANSSENIFNFDLETPAGR